MPRAYPWAPSPRSFQSGQGEENQASPLQERVGKIGNASPPATQLERENSRCGANLILCDSDVPRVRSPVCLGFPRSAARRAWGLNHMRHARPQLLAEEHGPLTEKPGSWPGPSPGWLCDLKQLPYPAGLYRRTRWPLRSPVHLLPQVSSINSKQFYKFSWQSLLRLGDCQHKALSSYPKEKEPQSCKSRTWVEVEG